MAKQPGPHSCCSLTARKLDNECLTEQQEPNAT